MPKKLEKSPSTASQTQKTLGPISDLERHLPPEWWRSLFNALYLKTDGDVTENDDATKAEIDALLDVAGMTPDDRVLDLCCGQGRHCLELARRGFANVTGVDRSRYLIRLARRRAKAQGLPVQFKEGDARRFALKADSFDCVLLLGNSFGYFEQEEDDLAVLTAVRRVLRSAGRLVLDVTDGEWMRQHYEPRTWEWIDGNQLVCRERSLSGDRSRLISREVVIHAEKGVIADQFYAERLYSADSLTALLENAGFRDIAFHQELEGNSSRQTDRGADLGMMARRHLVTCRAPVKAAAGGRGPAFPDVTVLMGDPRRPDQVKLGGKFNPEDMETIRRLKAALDTLGDYRFTYEDNHTGLWERLERTRPTFVFNLCDEGYNNEALKELHVPAMLEMLDIPYSGAGPAALGLCYDKAVVRAVAQQCEIPVPLETYFDPDDQVATIPSVFPALIKPAQGDSSIGITQNAVVHTPEEMVAYLAELRRTLPGRAVLVQEFLDGPEYSVALIGNPGHGFHALPVLGVDYSRLAPNLPRLLGYESKWQPESPYWNDISYKQAELDEESRRTLVDTSATLFQRLGCRDYARFDFRTDANGVIKLLEVNPNPGWCWDGKFNLMAAFEDLSYPDLLRMIIEAAQARLTAGLAEEWAAQPVRKRART
ncbi:MAG: D-alanine--D-alanine ligase [Rhodospirillales bacterium CG15_BIG_FIL_POST_REV_8_21_14_020_66_15]|nr:MAG: D-alanine--D-alanine ligase [Rhodospirillales bacterium CG15_BIG_FIL_POST_REV_8_21_14_020_66_15]